MQVVLQIEYYIEQVKEKSKKKKEKKKLLTDTVFFLCYLLSINIKSKSSPDERERIREI
jgi:hypothetical protein